MYHKSQGLGHGDDNIHETYSAEHENPFRFDPSPTALELTWAPSFCLEGGSLLRRLPRSSGSWAHVSHPNVGVNPPPEVVSVINEIMSARRPVLCFADNIS